MTVLAQTIVRDAQTALFDPEGVRWSAVELVSGLNAGQRELVRLRPDQKTRTDQVALVEGYRQAIPGDALSLIDIPGNASGRWRRITKVFPSQLDAVEPAWRARLPAAEIVHFMHDLRDPRSFLVYPPAKAGVLVELTSSVPPAAVPAPTGDAWSTVNGAIDVPDVWADALLNFVLFKAYSKDAEFGGNAGLAAGYLALFSAALDSQLQSTTLVASKA